MQCFFSHTQYLCYVALKDRIWSTRSYNYLRCPTTGGKWGFHMSIQWSLISFLTFSDKSWWWNLASHTVSSKPVSLSLGFKKEGRSYYLLLVCEFWRKKGLWCVVIVDSIRVMSHLLSPECFQVNIIILCHSKWQDYKQGGDGRNTGLKVYASTFAWSTSQIARDPSEIYRLKLHELDHSCAE